MRETETRFLQWGPVSLIIAKFVPGFRHCGAAIGGRTAGEDGGFSV